jgi:hypothetical protein
MYTSQLPETRKDALAIGARFYQRSKACHNGHNAPRYTTSGRCLSCMRAAYASKIPPNAGLTVRRDLPRLVAEFVEVPVSELLAMRSESVSALLRGRDALPSA